MSDHVQKLILVCECHHVRTMEGARRMLDSFRESVVPSREYGITLYEATPADLPEPDMVRQYRLTSSKIFHTPGMMAFAMNAFRSPTKKDRETAMEILANGYNLPRFVAWGLLDGCIPYRIEGDCVVFEVDTAPTKNGDRHV